MIDMVCDVRKGELDLSAAIYSVQIRKIHLKYFRCAFASTCQHPALWRSG